MALLWFKLRTHLSTLIRGMAIIIFGIITIRIPTIVILIALVIVRNLVLSSAPLHIYKTGFLLRFVVVVITIAIGIAFLQRVTFLQYIILLFLLLLLLF